MELVILDFSFTLRGVALYDYKDGSGQLLSSLLTSYLVNLTLVFFGCGLSFSRSSCFRLLCLELRISPSDSEDCGHYKQQNNNSTILVNAFLSKLQCFNILTV